MNATLENIDLGRLTRAERVELEGLLSEVERRESRRKLFTYFPEGGPYRRELYQRHMTFFELGKTHRIRGVLKGNRVGGTESAGGYEMVCHLTGIYPPWWQGRRFDGPTSWWAAGITRETMKDIIQRKLLGPPEAIGTGLIPGDLIVSLKPMPGVPGAYQTALVRHSSGGVSDLGFKSYDQGWETFQGTEKEGIWLDEESNDQIRAECVKRLATTNGLLIETFTPLKGLTKIVQGYWLGGKEDSRGVITEPETEKACVRIGWEHVPHLTEQAKKTMLAETPPIQRDAVEHGIPSLGAGAIYPVPESDIVVADFEIPEWFPRVYGMDVGWNRTAAVWAAKDRETGVVYLYAEHYRTHAEPVVNAHGIQARGAWIRGAIDPASRGRSQKDGDQLLRIYTEMGLHLEVAENGVEAGLQRVWEMLSSGRLKVFRSCVNWLAEFRIYRRNEKGQVVKENDHLMDATRYLVVSGLARATTKPNPNPERGRSTLMVRR